jgi:hypothetical protein
MHIGSSAVKFWNAMASVANRAGEWKAFKFITFSGEAYLAMILPQI